MKPMTELENEITVILEKLGFSVGLKHVGFLKSILIATAVSPQTERSSR